MSFANKVILIAGAAGNLGEAVAREFAETGAKLALVDRSDDQLHQVFPELVQNERHLMTNCADMTNPQVVRETVARVLDKFQRLDAMISVVGAFKAGSPLHETTLETLDFLMDVNARTFFIASQAVIPTMLEQGSGRIIGVAARPGLHGRANMSAYAASKSAVMRFTESMAEELKHDGITVNCVIPGTLDTPQNREALPDADFDRWVQPESLARVIVFLASDDARDISGSAVPVYGRS
jgi:NAD(P)-dependent dehydrogenase (short-subunit alcohol dehydrogenase family)